MPVTAFIPLSQEPPAPLPCQARLMAETAVEIAAVYKTFSPNLPALAGVSAKIRSGRITGLIGADGSGKTTLMRLIAALLLPDAGRITVLGVDVAQRPAQVQTQLGYLPQRFGLYEDLTVQENLELYAELQGLPPKARPLRYAQLLSMAGLQALTDRLAGKLSGGMKQKLGLACVLVGRPRLLLLDEPTVGVDPVSRRQLWQILYAQVQEGLTVLLSTTYLDEAQRCHEIILLHRGRVLGQGNPAKFIAPLAERVYRVRSKSASKRQLQRRLLDHPQVIDAVLEGDWVRLTTRAPAPPALEDLEITFLPVAPRLENVFIARLVEQGVRLNPASQILRRRSPRLQAWGGSAASLFVS